MTVHVQLDKKVPQEARLLRLMRRMPETKNTSWHLCYDPDFNRDVETGYRFERRGPSGRCFEASSVFRAKLHASRIAQAIGYASLMVEFEQKPGRARICYKCPYRQGVLTEATCSDVVINSWNSDAKCYKTGRLWSLSSAQLLEGLVT
jgi:hypothetical protein